MSNIFDLAEYILMKSGSMTAMKLQKLVYYCQAWSLVWDEKPLFRNRIEAWANGPVVRKLYDCHKGLFRVSRGTFQGDPATLDASERSTVDAILEFYGDKTSQYLSDLTHLEDPWKNARSGMPQGERGDVEITHAAMAEYYSSLKRS